MQTIHFGTVTDGITVASDADHNLTATAADGTLRWHAPTPRMWDSTPASGAPTSTPAPSTSAAAAKPAKQGAGANAQAATGTEAPTASAPGTAPGPTTTPAATPPNAKSSVPEISSADGPGTAAKIATMPVAATPTGIDLTPDRTVLATGTAPFYIDPAWIPWQNGVDRTRARIGS